MILTSKESDLLKDMKGAEELCIEKYTRYASEAKSEELKALLNKMCDTEREHLKNINSMMAGNEPAAPSSLSANNEHCVSCGTVYSNPDDKKNDQFILSDMLSTEKHVSSVYNTSVFEFKSPAARRMLAHIQAEEQQHGEMIYAFMNANSMYS